MRRQRDEYVPALGFRLLTPLYDFLIRWGLRESRWKGDLVGQADIRPGQSVLDLGCGTGTLLLSVVKAFPTAQAAGIDADPAVLSLAAKKAAKSQSAVRLDQGSAVSLPYPDGSFDHVFSTLVLHHLTGEEKRKALGEVVRVLKPGGWFHLVDWGKPHTLLLRAAFLVVRFVDGFARTRENVCGLLPALLREAGLGEPEQLGRYATVGGTLCRYRAIRP